MKSLTKNVLSRLRRVRYLQIFVRVHEVYPSLKQTLSKTKIRRLFPRHVDSTKNI